MVSMCEHTYTLYSEDQLDGDENGYPLLHALRSLSCVLCLQCRDRRCVCVCVSEIHNTAVHSSQSSGSPLLLIKPPSHIFSYVSFQCAAPAIAVTGSMTRQHTRLAEWLWNGCYDPLHWSNSLIHVYLCFILYKSHFNLLCYYLVVVCFCLLNSLFYRGWIMILTFAV